MSNPNALVQKLWNYCNILRDDGQEGLFNYSMRFFTIARFMWIPLVFAVVVAQAATLRVPTQYTNIQAAINFASAGDVVLVAPGRYTENITFNGKAITVISEAGPNSTILDGQGAGTVVAFRSAETRNSVLGGFTIRHGYGEFGSGVRFEEASATIVSNIFENNNMVSGTWGAAIGGNTASPVIEKNIFRHNSTDAEPLSGVVSFVNESSPRIANNIFDDNSGRAISLTLNLGSSPLVINNTIMGNSYGVRINGGSNPLGFWFLNNIVIRNIAGLQVENGATLVWKNNLVGGNQTDYAGIANQTGTNGNITGVPSFACINTRDFHLRPGSVGIDAGDNSAPQLPATDFEGHNRIVAGQSNGPVIVDMGAFEFDPAAPVSLCPGPTITFLTEPFATNCHAPVTLEAGVMQSNGDALLVAWRLNGSLVQEDTIEPNATPYITPLTFTATLPLGTNLVVVTVTDSTTNGSDSTTVTVVDAVPPVMECPTNLVVDMTTPEGAPAFFTVTATDLCSSAVGVVCEPPSGTLFLRGTANVACVATDESGNRTECSFYVTVLAPLGTKLAVLAEMVHYQESIPENLPALNKAIMHLRRATEIERWYDDSILRNHRAARVFWDEVAAVGALQRQFHSRRNPIPDEILRQWMERMAKADRALATVRIDRAAQNEARPSLLANAARDLAKGDRARDRGHFATAILHYFNAWKPAERFMHYLETHE